MAAGVSRGGYRQGRVALLRLLTCFAPLLSEPRPVLPSADVIRFLLRWHDSCAFPAGPLVSNLFGAGTYIMHECL